MDKQSGFRITHLYIIIYIIQKRRNDKDIALRPVCTSSQNNSTFYINKTNKNNILIEQDWVVCHLKLPLNILTGNI